MGGADLKTACRLLQRVLLIATMLWVGLCMARGQAGLSPQGTELIVVINGQIGGMPTFGSGIIFAREKDRLYIVTANHVVRSGGAAASDLRVSLRSLPNKYLKAQLLPQSDRELDLAVLTVGDLATDGVDVCKLSLDRLADPSTVKRGVDVYPVGNPNGVAWGLPVKPDAISDVTGDNLVFQSTLIARGHSGGGLLNEGGQLIGLIQADEPPFGRALGMHKTLEALRAWNLPVHLRIQSPDGVPPLLSAADRGDLGEAKLLLREICTDVNVSVDRNTPLLLAAKRGQAEMVKLLVEAGAETNAPDNGHRPLDFAAESGNAEVVQFLITHGARVNVNSTCCLGALHLAAARGALDAIRVLLAHGAEPNAVGDSNHTPLFSALDGGRQTEEGEPRQAARDAILRALIEAGAKVNWVASDGDTPLTVAVESGNLRAVRILLEAGANVDVKNRNKESPIGLARQREIAALLALSSSKIEAKDGLVLLERAAGDGWAEVADALVNHGVSVKGESGNVALKEAVVKGYTEVVKVLLQAGAHPNGGGPPTPLQRILGGVNRSDSDLDPAKRLEMVKLLTSKGAKVNVYPTEPDLLYMEPLYLALISMSPPDLRVAEVLIARGANVNARYRNGASLLDVAMGQHLSEAVQFLLKAGARKSRPAK